MSLELIPFTDEEALICIWLGPKGKWFMVSQIARVVFGWEESVLRQKFKFSEMTTKNKYNTFSNTDEYLLDKLKAIHMIPEDAESVVLISLCSLDLFIKSYSKRMSLFTRLYDTVHMLQWGTGDSVARKGNSYSKRSVPNSKFNRNGGQTSKQIRKRTLTSADKKYVAALQKWTCAWCGEVLPARFEVDHIVQHAEGGTDSVENLQALCPNCHADKTEMDRQVTKEEEKQKEIQRDNPYVWDEDIIPSTIPQFPSNNNMKKRKNSDGDLDSFFKRKKPQISPKNYIDTADGDSEVQNQLDQQYQQDQQSEPTVSDYLYTTPTTQLAVNTNQPDSLSSCSTQEDVDQTTDLKPKTSISQSFSRFKWIPKSEKTKSKILSNHQSKTKSYTPTQPLKKDDSDSPHDFDADINYYDDNDISLPPVEQYFPNSEEKSLPTDTDSPINQVVNIKTLDITSDIDTKNKTNNEEDSDNDLWFSPFKKKKKSSPSTVIDTNLPENKSTETLDKQETTTENDKSGVIDSDSFSCSLSLVYSPLTSPKKKKSKLLMTDPGKRSDPLEDFLRDEEFKISIEEFSPKDAIMFKKKDDSIIVLDDEEIKDTEKSKNKKKYNLSINKSTPTTDDSTENIPQDCNSINISNNKSLSMQPPVNKSYDDFDYSCTTISKSEHFPPKDPLKHSYLTKMKQKQVESRTGIKRNNGLSSTISNHYRFSPMKLKEKLNKNKVIK